MAASPGIAKPSSAHGRETEARLRIGGGVRTILLLPQQHLCDYARGERPEYRQVGRAAVGLESLGRRQCSFIGPPEPMLFYKLPGLFHLTPLTAARPLSISISAESVKDAWGRSGAVSIAPIIAQMIGMSVIPLRFSARPLVNPGGAFFIRAGVAVAASVASGAAASVVSTRTCD